MSRRPSVAVTLATYRDRCHPSCPGWFVNTDSLRVERCDECSTLNNAHWVTDSACARLPAARLARSMRREIDRLGARLDALKAKRRKAPRVKAPLAEDLFAAVLERRYGIRLERGAK